MQKQLEKELAKKFFENCWFLLYANSNRQSCDFYYTITRVEILRVKLHKTHVSNEKSYRFWSQEKKSCDITREIFRVLLNRWLVKS